MLNRAATIIFLAAALWAMPVSAQWVSDEDVRKAMIAESIATYRGNCPCPYNHASNGSLCGKRSAYSRPGGASPLCYPQDITRQMIDEYRRRKGLSK